jgi:hypothetical protein
VSHPGRRGIGSVQQLMDLVRCLARHSTRVCVPPGGDARQLAAVEPALVRKTPTGGNRRARCPLPARLWDADSAAIGRPIRRLPDRRRNLPTVLRPDSGVIGTPKGVVAQAYQCLPVTRRIRYCRIQPEQPPMIDGDVGGALLGSTSAVPSSDGPGCAGVPGWFPAAVLRLSFEQPARVQSLHGRQDNHQDRQHTLAARPAGPAFLATGSA